MSETDGTSLTRTSTSNSAGFAVYEDIVNKYNDLFSFNDVNVRENFTINFNIVGEHYEGEVFKKGSDEANAFDTVNGYDPDTTDTNRMLGVVIEVPSNVSYFMATGGVGYYAAGSDLENALLHNPLGAGTNREIWTTAKVSDKKYIITYIPCAEKDDEDWKLIAPQTKKMSIFCKDESGNPVGQKFYVTLKVNYENGGNIMSNLGFKRIMNSGTYYLDQTTTTAIDGDLNALVGKAVALVGNEEVGYGTADKPLLGFIMTADYEDQGSEKIVVTVESRGGFEGVAATGVVAGDGVTVNGSGGVQKATAGLARGIVIAFEDSKAKIFM